VGCGVSGVWGVGLRGWGTYGMMSASPLVLHFSAIAPSIHCVSVRVCVRARACVCVSQKEGRQGTQVAVDDEGESEMRRREECVCGAHVWRRSARLR